MCRQVHQWQVETLGHAPSNEATPWLLRGRRRSEERTPVSSERSSSPSIYKEGVANRGSQLAVTETQLNTGENSPKEPQPPPAMVKISQGIGGGWGAGPMLKLPGLPDSPRLSRIKFGGESSLSAHAGGAMRVHKRARGNRLTFNTYGIGLLIRPSYAASGALVGCRRLCVWACA